MSIADLLDEITPPVAAKGEQDGYEVVAEKNNGAMATITGARWDHREKRIILETE